MARQPPADLEKALKGESPALTTKDAVYRLARSAAPGTKERLSRLVRERGSPAIGRRAALGLSLVIDARTALRGLLGVAEPSVLAHVLLSLARVGTAEVLNNIRVVATRLSGHDAEQAHFAELLLAHRLGLGLDVVLPVSTPPVSQVPDRTKAVTLGNPQETTSAWNRFAPNASLGFEPDSQRCAMIHCARRMILFIPAIELVKEDGRHLLRSRTIVGATAANDRETGSWYHDLWILSTPVSGGVELQAWTQGGRACYTGKGRVGRGDLSFELQTAESSGLALARVRGRFGRDGLAIDGTVGDRDPSDSRTPTFRLRAQ
jgi:hypothetical protein